MFLEVTICANQLDKTKVVNCQLIRKKNSDSSHEISSSCDVATKHIKAETYGYYYLRPPL